MIGRQIVMTALTAAVLLSCGDNGGGAAAANEFCDAAGAAKTATEAQQALFSTNERPTPDQVRPAVEDFARKFAAMAAAAPSEMKDSVGTINNVAQQLLDLVKANGFDVATLVDKPEFVTLSEAFGTDEYAAAEKAFGDYTEKTCSITDTTQV